MKSIEARLRAIEKVVGVPNVRRGYSLHQLVIASMGGEPGAPSIDLADNEPSLEELVLACRDRTRGLMSEDVGQ